MAKRKNGVITKADGILVHCAHDTIVATDSLISNPRNPNRHPEEQIRLLAKIIKHQGWRAPIAVSNRSGFVIRGHARLMAAVVLGAEQVPVDFQDYASEAEEWADLIADNRIAELAESDLPRLKDLLQELDSGLLESLGADMEIAGWTQAALADLMSQFHVGEDEKPAGQQSVASQFMVVIECADEVSQTEVLAVCAEHEWQCRALVS